MIDRTDEQLGLAMRRIVTLHLWQLGAIKVSLTKPYRLASGNFAPIYVNCRLLISSPSFADIFAAAARMICETERIEFDVIAGGETAGIPFAAFLARALGRPMVYVRKEQKGHGTGSQIEGSLRRGARVLLVEDLITDAGSKLTFIRALHRARARVKDVLVIFDRLQGGREALAREGVRLHTVTNMDTALLEARAVGLLTARDLKSVQGYLKSPRAWHQKRSLPFRSTSRPRN